MPVDVDHRLNEQTTANKTFPRVNLITPISAEHLKI